MIIHVILNVYLNLFLIINELLTCTFKIHINLTHYKIKELHKKLTLDISTIINAKIYVLYFAIFLFIFHTCFMHIFFTFLYAYFLYSFTHYLNFFRFIFILYILKHCKRNKCDLNIR